MHPEDGKSRAAGVLCIVVGLGFAWWAWHDAQAQGTYTVKLALLGPVLAVLGLGLLIHGRGIPTSGATRLTRVYGFAGGMASIAFLYLLGYFSAPQSHAGGRWVRAVVPLSLLGVWFLPARLFGPQPSHAGAPSRHPTEKPPGPIEP